jgi:ATP-dependent Clp protease adaptor protein ClpS
LLNPRLPARQSRMRALPRSSFSMIETTVEPEVRTQESIDTPGTWWCTRSREPDELRHARLSEGLRLFAEKAERHMLEVHRNGRSIVWTGLREPAESYVQQLHENLLLATLEKSG